MSKNTFARHEELEAAIANGVLKIDGNLVVDFSIKIDANIDAGNIKAVNIDAGNINYYAVCFSYRTFACKSIAGRRKKSRHFCLDNEIVYKEE